MNQELWRRAEDLFHAALERSPEARRAFLDEACGEDTELLRQVEMLVSKDEHAGSFLEKPVLADVAAAPGTSNVSTTAKSLQNVGSRRRLYKWDAAFCRVPARLRNARR